MHVGIDATHAYSPSFALENPQARQEAAISGEFRAGAET
jgi:hypothetical protein